MLATQIMQKCIDDLLNITKVELSVLDTTGMLVATTEQAPSYERDAIESFVESAAASQTLEDRHYIKVVSEEEVAYVVVSKDNAEALMVARIAVSQIKSLMVAYKEKLDKNNFYQNLLMDNLLLVDIYNYAKKLHIEAKAKRAVVLVEIQSAVETGTMEMLKNMFAPQSGDFVTAVDEKNIILVKQLEASQGYGELEEISDTILAMLNTEVMVNGKIAYGTIVEEVKDVSKSYKEAKMALDVGKIFYADKDVVAYNTLGIGRLIYQLPINLCQMFIQEIFGDDIPEELDEETLNTIDIFLANSLNVSETARQLYVHRNTLLYRLEKLHTATNLDIRVFDDALTLKIALMVVNYMKYLQTQDF